MKENIVIVGAGGFGREVQWLIERINAQGEQFHLLGYIDDGVECGTIVDGLPVLGNMEYLLSYHDRLAVACAVGSAKTRRSLMNKLQDKANLIFPNLIDPSALCSDRIMMGHGNIICAGNILTVDIRIGDFNIINLDCTIGHDAVFESYITVYPSANISGCVTIGAGTEIGTGSHIIQGITVGSDTVVGAGAVVIREIPSECTVVGNPAKPIKIRGGGLTKILIAGASGHGRVIGDIWKESIPMGQCMFLDDNTQLQKKENVLGGISYAIEHKEAFDVIVGIGNAKIRKKIQQMYEAEGVSVVSLIHPSASVADNVEIECGTVVMAGAVVQSGTQLGKGVIINTACSVDHDNVIGDYCHVAVGSHLAGDVKVGDGTWIGAGAVVSNGVTICPDVVVGAGAVVVRDIAEPGTYVGVPARKME